MRIGCIFAIVIIWTLASTILSLCGVGRFAEFPITAWPWHWSCLCILYWVAITCTAFFIGVMAFCLLGTKRELRAKAEKDAMGRAARLIMQNDVEGAWKLAKDTWGDRIPEKVKKALMEAAQTK
jgi:Ni/Fe-hydrogenase subunit HybB-like protein